MARFAARRFAPDATRFENGMKFAEIEKGFKSGRYRFNERVRDRDCFLLDEERAASPCAAASSITRA